MSIGHNMYRDNSPGATTVLIEMVFGVAVIIAGATAWVAVRLSRYAGLALIRCWMWSISLVSSYAAFIWLSGYGIVTATTSTAVIMVLVGAASIRLASQIAYKNSSTFSNAFSALTHQSPNLLRHNINQREPVTLNGEYTHER